MKTREYHISNFGSFAPYGVSVDCEGYVTYHASERYRAASSEQLEQWAKSRVTAVANAALTEMAERSLQEWQNGN